MKSQRNKYNVEADGYHIEIPYTSQEIKELLDQNKHIEKFLLKRNKIEARSASFGKGGERTAFEGIFVESEREIVLKQFNKKRPFEFFIETIERQFLCSSYANEFNKLNVTEKRIQFIPTTLFISNPYDGKYDNCVLTKDELSPLLEKCGIFLVEPFLNGHFEKYNCNNGYIWFDSFHATLHAFSHWTWTVTNHELLIADLQGISIGNCFYLTDPAILSTNREKFEFSMTNLNEDGISKFFSTHYCNQICIALGIENNLHSSQIVGEIVSTPTPVNEQMTSVNDVPNICLGFCVVVREFKAEDERDLSLEKDDVIEIMAKEGDWWIGRKNGKEGVFPKNCVQELLKMFLFICSEDYKANENDELSVKKGDLVYLIGRKNGLVRVVSIDGNERKFGFIPVDIVEPL